MGSGEAAANPPTIQYRWVAGPGDARRLAWASVTRPPLLIGWFIVWVIWVALTWALSGKTFALGTAGVYLVVFAAILWLVTYGRLRK